MRIKNLGILVLLFLLVFFVSPLKALAFTDGSVTISAIRFSSGTYTIYFDPSSYSPTRTTCYDVILNDDSSGAIGEISPCNNSSGTWTISGSSDANANVHILTHDTFGGNRWNSQAITLDSSSNFGTVPTPTSHPHPVPNVGASTAVASVSAGISTNFMRSWVVVLGIAGGIWVTWLFIRWILRKVEHEALERIEYKNEMEWKSKQPKRGYNNHEF